MSPASSDARRIPQFFSFEGEEDHGFFLKFKTTLLSTQQAASLKTFQPP
jgi:hypothetical protein